LTIYPEHDLLEFVGLRSKQHSDQEVSSMANDQTPTKPNSEPNTLVIEDRVLSHGFIQLPKLVLHARNVSRDAKFLYAVLLGYAWQAGSCFPGYTRLCEDLQASENMVRKYMRELESAGLLIQRRRGLGKTNIYTLPDIRTSKIAVQDPQETAAKKEAEESDANLRNSNDSDRKEADSQPPGHRIYETHRHQTLQQPVERARPTSPPARRHGNLSSISEILIRRDRPSMNLTQAPHLLRHQYVPDQISAYVAEIAREMGDQAKARSNLTYAMRLCKESGCHPNRFASILLEARAITRDRRSVNHNQTVSPELRRPMAYFWRVVRSLLDLAQTIPDGDRACEVVETTIHRPNTPVQTNPQLAGQMSFTENPGESQNSSETATEHG
jgi:Helix-turn-helix domain